MDALLARKLTPTSSLSEPTLYNKLARLAKDYIQSGRGTLDFHVPDFDICNDMLQCWAPINGRDFEKRDRSAPENFIHPMGATELWTLATFLSQILAGGDTTRKVEPRNPEDEPKADTINEVLQWNDQQQDTYGQIFSWCLDAVTFNRGVMYDRWKDIYEVSLKPERYTLPWEPPLDDDGKPMKDPETGKKMKKPKGWTPEVYTRFKKVRTKLTGFTKIDNLSPYDFICDPTMPPPRFQEGRFAGHRVILTWAELERRSKLPETDYEYVLPHVVKKLKNSDGRRAPTIAAAGTTTTQSRSYLERSRRQQPIANATTGGKINKEDGGVVECWCLQIRLRPSEYSIFEEDTEEEKVEFLIAGETDLLSVNVMTNKHDQYPYAVGEARASAHQQYTPSWSLIIKGPQDYVDYLKNRHKESLARTSGNIFVGIPEYIDFEAFTDPKKDGLVIPLTKEGVDSGKPLDQIIKQIPVVDTTARFYDEMAYWQKCGEETTGAHAPIQGSKQEGDPTATEFVGTQQMAQGRISTIARLLSSRALVPQTQRIVSNAQQFLPDSMIIRITGKNDEFDPEHPPEKFTTVVRDADALETGLDENGEPALDDEGKPIPRDPLLDLIESKQLHDIQGNFDVVPHDGSLPGTDARKVAALSRALEIFGSNPMLAPVFDTTRPGAYDPIKLAEKLFSATGVPQAGIRVTAEQARENAQRQLLAQGGGLGMPAQAPAIDPATGAPAPAPSPIDPATGMPSATEVPPTPTAEPVMPNAGNTLTGAPTV